jgi:tartrate-resistant acid phosphatase type 5
MTRNRREILGGTAAIAGEALAFHARAASPADLSFVVVGDWGRDGASHQRDVADQMELAARASNSRFVMAVGDNFYEDGVQSVTDAKWRTSFEDVYTGDHLRQTPWYAALGNHDYGGVPQAQVDYTALSSRWRMPARYFKLPGTATANAPVDIFVIDTTPLIAENGEGDRPMARNVKTEDAAAQLRWLDGQLAASQASFKLVCGHHTLFSGGSTHGDTPDLVAHLLPVLQRHGVTAYINGHDHDLQHIVRDGMSFVCTGAGSEVRPVSPVAGTRFCVARSGFSIVSLRDGRLGLEFRDYTGASLYRGEIA